MRLAGKPPAKDRLENYEGIYDVGSCGRISHRGWIQPGGELSLAHRFMARLCGGAVCGSVGALVEPYLGGRVAERHGPTPSPADGPET